MENKLRNFLYEDTNAYNSCHSKRKASAFRENKRHLLFRKDIHCCGFILKLCKRTQKKQQKKKTGDPVV